MDKPRSIDWFRIGAESVAIMASILLAFAVDAWWAEHVDRRSQVEELGRLYDEFIQVRELLHEETREEKVTAAVQMLQMLQEHVDRSELLALPTETLNDVLSWGNFDVATPVLDGIILSGRLDRMESQRVVAAITTWRVAISEVETNELGSRELTQKFLIPAFIARGNMSDVLSERNQATTAVLVDDELIGYVALRQRIVRGDSRRLESLRPMVNELLEAVDEALGK